MRVFGEKVLPLQREPWAPGNYIRDVWIKDVQFNGDESHLHQNTIRSYDAEHAVSDLHFENIRVNGKKVKVAKN